jgi:serine/threonine-protein kinase
VDAYAAVIDLGFILVDAYLGNILLDFENVKVWCFDWDLSQRGDGFTLEAERNYGSNRLMAPEEFAQGSWLDQRTNVFNIGKLISILLPDGGEDVDDVIDHATQVEPDDRFATVQALADHYRVAAGLPPAHGVILVEDED